MVRKSTRRTSCPIVPDGLGRWPLSEACCVKLILFYLATQVLALAIVVFYQPLMLIVPPLIFAGIYLLMALIARLVMPKMHRRDNTSSG